MSGKTSGRRASRVELRGGDMRRQAASLELATRDRESIVLQELVERSRFAQVAFARAGAHLAPSEARRRSSQTLRVAQQRPQPGLTGLDVPTERDPRQGLPGLSEHVVRQCPVVTPGTQLERLSLPRQMIEITPLLGFTDPPVDVAFPLR